MRRVEPSDHYAAPGMTEAQLRTRVVELAHAAGWRVFAVPVVRGQGRWYPKEGVGYPDLTLARHREVRFLELKVGAGRATPEQEAWIDALPASHLIRTEDLTNGRLVRLLV